MKCDVKGCKYPSSSGGPWTASGRKPYWRLCHRHFVQSLSDQQTPVMKRKALEYNISRGKDGVYLSPIWPVVKRKTKG